MFLSECSKWFLIESGGEFHCGDVHGLIGLILSIFWVFLFWVMFILMITWDNVLILLFFILVIVIFFISINFAHLTGHWVINIAWGVVTILWASYRLVFVDIFFLVNKFLLVLYIPSHIVTAHFDTHFIVVVWFCGLAGC